MNTTETPSHPSYSSHPTYSGSTSGSPSKNSDPEGEISPEIPPNSAPPPLLSIQVHPLHPSNTLSVLTQDQLDQLFDWLLTFRYEDVQQRLFHQFRIHASIPCLCRYFKRRQAEERKRDAIELLPATAAVPSLSLDPSAAREQLRRSAEDTFNQILFEITHGSTGAQNFSHLARFFTEQQQNQLKEKYLALADKQAEQRVEQNRERIEIQRQRLALQTRTFEFNAAKAALKHAAELLEILKDLSIDDEKKIWKSRDLLFSKRENEKTETTDPQPSKPLAQ